jgi:hypothetical protein
MERRTFLKLSAASAAASLKKTALCASKEEAVWASGRLPEVPGLRDLGSVPMTRSYFDLFNLPIAMNDWGSAQAVKSVSGISAIAFPPYASCGVPEIAWSPGFLTTCELFLNNKLLAVWGPPDNRITYTWFPHCVVREQTAEEICFRATLALPPDQRAVLQRIEVQNCSQAQRRISLGFSIRAGVTRKTGPWFTNSPAEDDNDSAWNAEKGRLTFHARHSTAACAQGVHPPAQHVMAKNMLVYEMTLGPGEKREMRYVLAMAETVEAANRLHDLLQANFERAMQDNERTFERLVHSAFTPGNPDFSGHLPRLITNNETLWRLYHNGFKNLLSARRRSPDSAYGVTYTTLSGHVLPTLSFPWDTALSGLSLALLDPEPLRKLVEVWFEQDMHAHLATDYVSGQAVGPWYGVNDMSIVGCARDYLRVTGDFGWLDKHVDGRTVLDHLEDHALYWKKLRSTDRGLADYGKIENLLEVVSTYLHEVAGMNAGNVSSMRFVAALLERRGESEKAQALRAEARELAQRINQLLYVDGKGWWRCGQPDGTFYEVRHCYDFLAVLDHMAEDLTERQKDEMAKFFRDQLQSHTWMRALASSDPDATWNIRPDHSCLGSYAAWPPMCARGLYKIDAPASIARWLRELAKAGEQGPIGQAHFTEDIAAPVRGGAYKCPNDAPYLNDWCCISGAAFCNLVLDSIFHADLTLFDGIQAQPRLAEFDSEARLEGLHYQGKEYVVTRAGVSQ